MSVTKMKVGANEPCPCGRKGRKYKQCCRGRTDWEAILPLGLAEQVRHLSTRGKNIVFIHLVLEALQFDTERKPVDQARFKKAFTAEAVRKIFEAVRFVWPDGEDLKRVLIEDGQETSGLYIGHYVPDRVERAVTRHSLYADRILLVDPLTYPDAIREQYNPILHPEMHRTTTLKWIHMWLGLWEWIDEGLVAFVRSPGDFYPQMASDSYAVTRARFKRHPELTTLGESYARSEFAKGDLDEWKENFMLSHSDEQLASEIRERKPDATEAEITSFLEHVRRRREQHPYYLDFESGPDGVSSELLQTSTGTNYELAKAIALHSNSFIMTDLPVRWREIELDRTEAGIDSGAWAPFAKAFQELPLRFLDDVPLEAALVLRKEGRLQPMRDFLRKTWNGTTKVDPFADQNATNLAAELSDKLREAESEWQKIDTELAETALKTLGAGVLAAGPAIASGFGSWLGASLALGGTAALVRSHRSRSTYKLRYPAGFFVDLQNRKAK
jgi:hypothetical protein